MFLQEPEKENDSRASQDWVELKEQWGERDRNTFNR